MLYLRTFKRRIRDLGRVSGITIPKEIMKYENLKEGDEIKLTILQIKRGEKDESKFKSK